MRGSTKRVRHERTYTGYVQTQREGKIMSGYGTKENEGRGG